MLPTTACAQEEKAPTTATKKADMISWLKKYNIPVAPDMLKAELYELVKRNKPRQKKYEIDRIAREHGHTVVRLPPYHCDLNPIELIWANIKNHVARHNTTWKMAEVEKLCKEAVSLVTMQNWKDAVAHCQKLEEDYWRKDGLIEDRVGELIISLGEDSDTDSSQGDISDDDVDDDDDDDLGCTPLSSQ